ncbi:hypothetical protein AB1285_17895 [Microbacterium sp. NRRL B-14842]|uniref:hypothetical protein n=1 Tax=Microbacterium sp. NRRL B-14842 TaxID=3162881 RepID=UPI003D2AE064
MLLTLNTQLHLLKMLDDDLFIYLAADRQATNLALLRLLGEPPGRRPRRVIHEPWGAASGEGDSERPVPGSGTMRRPRRRRTDLPQRYG